MYFTCSFLLSSVSKWPYSMLEVPVKSTVLPHLSSRTGQHKMLSIGTSCGITGNAVQVPDPRLSGYFPLSWQIEARTELQVSSLQVPLRRGRLPRQWQYPIPRRPSQEGPQCWYAWRLHFQPQICQIQPPRCRERHLDADRMCCFLFVPLNPCTFMIERIPFYPPTPNRLNLFTIVLQCMQSCKWYPVLSKLTTSIVWVLIGKHCVCLGSNTIVKKFEYWLGYKMVVCLYDSHPQYKNLEQVFNCYGYQFCLHFEAFNLGMAPVYMAFIRFMGDDQDARKFSYSLEVGGNGRKMTWQGVPRSIRDTHTKVRDSMDGLIIQRSMALFFSGGNRQELKLKVAGRIWKEEA